MAVDTRNKRFSILRLHQPVPSLLANPDGTIAAADRAMLLYLYHGIALSGGGAASNVPRVYHQYRRRRV